LSHLVSFAIEMYASPFSVLLLLFFSIPALATPTAVEDDDEEWFKSFLEETGDFLAEISQPGSSSDTFVYEPDMNGLCDGIPMTGLGAFPDISDPLMPDIEDIEASLDHILPIGPIPVVETVELTPQDPSTINDLVVDYSRPNPDYMDALAAIDCPAPIPVIGWPTGRHPSMYNNDLRTLCSFLGRFIQGHSANLGCACKSPVDAASIIRCYPAVADPAFSGSVFLRQYCANKCTCRKYPNGVPNYKDVQRVHLTKPGNHQCSLIEAFKAGSQYSSPPGPPAKKSIPNPPDFYGNSRSNRQRERYCRIGCSQTEFNCGSRSSGCTCDVSKVAAGLWQGRSCRPRSAQEIAVATISSLGGISGLPGGGRKRKRDAASGPVCACNATYVSKGCCSSLDGLIWEHPDHYLGEMVPIP
jgi:hypothetical protein